MLRSEQQQQQSRESSKEGAVAGTLPQNRETKNMVSNTAELEIKNSCAGEARQKFMRPMTNKVRGPVQDSIYAPLEYKSGNLPFEPICCVISVPLLRLKCKELYFLFSLYVDIVRSLDAAVNIPLLYR
jgi:hypothetical protein